MSITTTSDDAGRWQFSIDLGGKVERVVKARELVIIKTPGGGGFGRR